MAFSSRSYDVCCTTALLATLVLVAPRGWWFVGVVDSIGCVGVIGERIGSTVSITLEHFPHHEWMFLPPFEEKTGHQEKG